MLKKLLIILKVLITFIVCYLNKNVEDALCVGDGPSSKKTTRLTNNDKNIAQGYFSEQPSQ